MLEPKNHMLGPMDPLPLRHLSVNLIRDWEVNNITYRRLYRKDNLLIFRLVNL